MFPLWRGDNAFGNEEQYNAANVENQVNQCGSFGVLLPEIEAMMATTHEPMLDPMVRKMPWSSVMSCVTTMAMAMDVITDELWMMAVRIAPMTTKRIGLPILAKNILTESRAAKSLIELLIMLKPTNNMPNPAKMPPMVFVFAFLPKSETMAPIPAKAEK